MNKILLVEDDPNITKSLLFVFEKNELEADHAVSLSEAKRLYEENKYDLFLFDIGLKDGSGIDLTKYLRRNECEKPIILITARMDEDTLLNGFEAGANDYLRKPFSNVELLARIKSNLKRIKREETIAKFKSLSVNMNSRTCSYKSEDIKLNRRQLDILYYFIKNEGNVISRDSLLQYLEIDVTAFDRTIDSHVSQLRKKLEKAGVDEVKITSIYGVGYKFEE